MQKKPSGSRGTAGAPPRGTRAAGTSHDAQHAPLGNAHGNAQRDAAHGAPKPTGILPFLTVAVGASAGGLHAFTTLLSNLPPDTGMTFVLIQHLDPIHRSLLVDLLAPHTAMPVLEAADGMQLTPNTVFVIPPDATMTVRAGRLAVASPAPSRANRWPIDTFFTSLAEDQRHHAVCIILSGAGSDGSRALREVKHRGGLILAQSLDDGQVMSGMPHTAASTGLVDHVLTVSAMPAALLYHQRSVGNAAPVPDLAAPGDAGAWQIDPPLFAEIFAMLRGRIGHDFSQYKAPTLSRRIRHRMQAQGIATVPDLIDVLHRDPRQIDQLFHDLLVGVTQFFRDPAAFLAVQETALPQILADTGAADAVRIWVPGCASGEEVYSLAILLREQMDRQQNAPKAQIFGTDIDEAAITAARAARYREAALVRMTPERRARWFVEDGEFHRPVREIREMCVFSVHSVIRDPPFSKLDLISCRNLLIYLGGELQDRVINSFHYALNPGGWLFLGPSESTGHRTSLFEPVDKRYRLFRRREPKALRPALVPRLNPAARHGLAPGSGASPRRNLAPRSGVAPGDAAPAGLLQPETIARPLALIDDALDRSARRALEPYSPAYVVIDRACDIMRFSGGEVGRYLEPSPGVANLGLFGMLRRPLRRAVRSAVHKALTEHDTVLQDGLTLSFEARPHLVTLIVKPISDGRSDLERFLVAFLDAGPARRRASVTSDVTGAAVDDDRELARELAATRSQLLASIAEMETANEELRSFNEEFQSANEELQATNEELETAKEEMQSVNEELQTINAELTTRNDQLTTLNNDFQNLLDSTRIATVFLDRDLRITRFTPSITELFHLRDTDRGRPFTDIAGRLRYTGLAADVATVLGEARVLEREVRLADGDLTFLMRVQPYRTLDQAIEGVVVTFVDISAGKRSQAAAEETLRMLNISLERRVIERTTDLQTVNRALTQQIEVRQRAEEMLRQSQKTEAVGKLTGGIAHDFNNLLGVIIGNVELLMDGVRDQPELAELARDILDSALSGAELTRRLLAFARKQPLVPQVVDLNALLPGQVAMLRRALGQGISVTTTLTPALWRTMADPTQIGEALLNLVLNARDAMPLGGRLEITTTNTHLDPQNAAETTESGAGDYVVLTVTDSGTGMSPEVIERVTEPFFTTKPPGSGSGLGLSMAYGFARQSGGDLRIESEVGVGTTIRLYLPRAPDGAVTKQTAADPELPDPGGSETILLVDDNPTLRDVTRRHLISLGYGVTVAVNGPAALAVLRSGQGFDLLFTDVVMPEGLSGYELAEAARVVQPGLKLLFTTGFARDLSMEGDGTHDRPLVLRKPYRRTELAKAVRAALDGH